MYLKPQGSPSSKVWIVVDQPYPQDTTLGYIWSGGYGNFFRSMLAKVGIKDYHVVARRPDLDHPDTYRILEDELNTYQPPIVIPIEDAGNFLCRELVKNEFATRKLQQGQSPIHKYCGSLLRSDLLKYSHWVVPTFSPDRIIRQYDIKDFVTFIDLGKAATELEYWKQHGVLLGYRERILRYDIQDFDELMSYLERLANVPLVSNDIETVYPKNKKSEYWGHPGLPVCIGLGDSADFAISFELFRENIKQSIQLWRAVQRVFDRTEQLGQNFFNFDWHRYNMLGFRIDPARVHDTLIRQNILWPELPKDLATLTRQYTREPYYKDEGHGWSLKDLKKLKRYNCLDVAVTFEVFEAQQVEFNRRPQLLKTA